MKIKVNHFVYEVKPLPADKVAKGLMGLHEVSAPIIYIRADEHPAEQARILIHELLHALFHAHGLNPRTKGRYSEEEVCGILESPLTALFADNASLSREIRAALHGRPIVTEGKTNG